MIANSNTPRDYRNQTGARLVNYCLDDIFSLNPKVVTAQMRASITLGDLIVTNQTLQCAGAFGRRSQKSGICHVRLRSAGASTCVSHTWKAMADSGYRRVMRDGHTY